jgi:glycosyltransferase involved in cell wall biosynthesis
MRIPFEGILAARANPKAPLLISVWGNDFTLHATANPLIARYTRQTLHRADALQTDAQRDRQIAYDWGFDRQRPVFISPGAGGIRGDIFYPPQERKSGPPIIINPRGYRTYIRNDTFFQAIPLVLERHPEARFLCPDMETEVEAHQWVEKLGIQHAVDLLPRLPHQEMAALLRKAHIAVSPSTHDGTPNSLLEAIACGCFPIAGDIESLREWIIPDTNGILFDPTNPQALAGAILDAIENDSLRQKALDYNQNMISERAAYNTIMAKAEAFYKDIITTNT